MNSDAIYLEILDVLSGFSVPESMILHPHQHSSYVNFDLRRFSPDQITKVYQTMMTDNLIKVDYDENIGNVTFLTKKGGDRWENYFQPNWNIFVDVTMDDPENEKDPVAIEIYTPSPKFLSLIKNTLQPKLVTFNIEEKTIWNPVYWKSISDFKCYCLTATAYDEHQKRLINQAYEVASALAAECCPASNHF